MSKRRARLLNEFILGTLMELKKKPRLSKDSVDDQIDSILLKYESDCIVSMQPSADGTFGEGVLREAGEDDDEEGGAPAPKTPELGDPDEEKNAEIESQTANKDDQKPDVESDPLTPKIDLKMFCGKVSRLATNYDALLDMPIAIVNRARNYLKQNYGQALADEFAEIMERDYDIELQHEDPTEPRERPIAVGGAATGLG